jgi:NDP-sugar pyrophosphorylase family protein
VPELVQAVILAGGRGKRLGSITESIPKPMVRINGVPFLELKIREMMSRGILEFVLCVGYLGNIIEEHFGNGDRLGLKIYYSRDGTTPLGPIGALKKAEPLLKESFLVTYGDNYVSIDYRTLMEQLHQSKSLAVMAVYHNRNTLGRSDIAMKDKRIILYNKGGVSLEWINYGVVALKKKALNIVGIEFEDEEAFYTELIRRRGLVGFEAHQRFYEIGTPQSLEEFGSFVANGGCKPKLGTEK